MTGGRPRRHRRLRHPRLRGRRRVLPLPPGFALRRRRGLRLHLRHLAPRAGRPRRSCKAGETVLVLGAAGGVGTAAVQIAKAAGRAVIAAASSDEKCALCSHLGADATINYSTHDLRDALKALTGRQGPRRGLRPGGRRSGRAGVPLHRLARPLPGDRFRRWRHSGAALEPATAQGRVDRGRVLGRLRASANPRQRQRAGRAGAVVRARQDQARHRPAPADARAASAAYTRMGSRQVRGKLLLVNPESNRAVCTFGLASREPAPNLR
jgi:NADPH2:quinone reductase